MLNQIDHNRRSYGFATSLIIVFFLPMAICKELSPKDNLIITKEDFPFARGMRLTSSVSGCDGTNVQTIVEVKDEIQLGDVTVYKVVNKYDGKIEREGYVKKSKESIEHYPLAGGKLPDGMIRFPLIKGATYEYQSAHGKAKAWIEGVEKIKVPAGEFTCLVWIHEVGRASGTISRTKTWIAPGVGGVKTIAPCDPRAEQKELVSVLKEIKTDESNVPEDISRKHTITSSDDETTIRKIAQEFTQLFQLDRRDPFARLREMLADDVTVVTSSGHLLQGKEKTLQAYQQSWEKVHSEFMALKMRYDIQSVNMVGDASLVFGKIIIDGRLKNNNSPFLKEVWETLILQRINGQWQIVQEHSTTAAPTHDSKAEEQKLSAEQTRKVQEGIRGSFSGIGVEIDKRQDGIFLKKVIAGGPADNAGLNAEEIISAIDGQPTRDISLEQAVSLIKGPVGTNVKLKVLSKDGTSREVDVIRGTVVITGVESKILYPNIGLLTISAFTKQTPAEVQQVLDHFRKQKIRGLILDLRENKGGIYPAIFEVASMFVGRGRTMWQRQNVGQKQPTIVRAEQSKIVQWPVVVLIGPETRSGGELLACALRTAGQTKLLGQNTTGKGFFYELEEQADGTSKKVVGGYFFSADGQPINDRGIQPDQQVAPGTLPEDVLEQAVRELLKQI